MASPGAPSAVGHAPSPVPPAKKSPAPPVPQRVRPRAKPAPPNPGNNSQFLFGFMAIAQDFVALKPNPRDLMKKGRSAADVTSLQDDINMKAAFKYNPILEQQVSAATHSFREITFIILD